MEHLEMEISPKKKKPKYSDNFKSEDGKQRSKFYKQKFRNCWLDDEFRPWISRHPVEQDKPYCLFCERKLEGGVCHLRRHAKTRYHVKRGKLYYSQFYNAEEIPQTQNVVNSQTSCVNGTFTVTASTSNDRTPANILTTIDSSDSAHMEAATTDVKVLHHPSIIVSDNDVSGIIKLQSSHKHEIDQSLIEKQVVSDTNADNNIFEHTTLQAEFVPSTSSEVTVHSSDVAMHHPPLTSSIGPSTGHITVTIQGQEPLYIQSAAEHVHHEEHHAAYNMEMTDETDVKPPLLKNNIAKRYQKVSRKARVKHFKPVHKKERNEVEDDRKPRKWYKQKFSEHWSTSKELSEWLARAPNDVNTAYCTACDKKLEGGIAHLRRHADTPYHTKRMKETVLKRHLVLAKQAELNISKFAEAYNVPVTAVTAMPDLLMLLFPESPVCQLLSAERLGVMMLVRKDIHSSDNNALVVDGRASKDNFNSGVFDNTLHHSEDYQRAMTERTHDVSIDNDQWSSNTTSTVASSSIDGTNTCTTIVSSFQDVQNTNTIVHEVEAGRQCSMVPLDCRQPQFIPANNEEHCPNAVTSSHAVVNVSIPQLHPSQQQKLLQSSSGNNAVVTLHSNAHSSYVTPSTARPYHTLAPPPCKQQKRVAIVTGADSCLGLSVCRTLVKKGFSVVGVTYSPTDNLKSLIDEMRGPGVSLAFVTCDMSKDDKVRDMFRYVTEFAGIPQVCINIPMHPTSYEASVVEGHGSILYGEPEHWRQILDTSIVGVCLLSKLLIQSLNEKNMDESGHIINIFSCPENSCEGQGATKLFDTTSPALRVVSGCLRHELKMLKSDIKVTLISPPVMSSGEGQDSSAELRLQSDSVALSVTHALSLPPQIQVNDVSIR